MSIFLAEKPTHDAMDKFVVDIDAVLDEFEQLESRNLSSCAQSSLYSTDPTLDSSVRKPASLWDANPSPQLCNGLHDNGTNENNSDPTGVGLTAAHEYVDRGVVTTVTMNDPDYEDEEALMNYEMTLSEIATKLVPKQVDAPSEATHDRLREPELQPKHLHEVPVKVEDTPVDQAAAPRLLSPTPPTVLVPTTITDNHSESGDQVEESDKSTCIAPESLSSQDESGNPSNEQQNAIQHTTEIKEPPAKPKRRATTDGSSITSSIDVTPVTTSITSPSRKSAVTKASTLASGNRFVRFTILFL